MNSNSLISVDREPMLQMSEERKQELNNFIINNMGTPFHEVHFNCIASECFKTHAMYLIAYKGSEIVGVCPVHYLGDGIAKIGYSSLISYEIPYGGWIYNKEKISIRELIKCLKVEWNEKFVYSSNIILDDTENDYRGFTPRETVIVDLKGSVDEIFNGLNGKTRNRIRRSTKKGINIRYLSISEFDEFIRLTRILKKRIGLPSLNDFYYKVFNEYHTRDRIKCIAAEHENGIISAKIIIANTNFSIGWLAGRENDLPNNLYQDELIIWECIAWSKINNCKYFDLNGLHRKKLPHLAHIKLSFSRDIRRFYGKNYNRIMYKLLSGIQNFTGR